MKKKSLLMLTMVTLLCISSIVQAFAVGGNEKSDLISKEEFSNTMTELYKKYELNFEVVDDSNYNAITRDVFESELNEVEKNLVDAINIRNENKDKLLKLQKENEISIVEDMEALRIMEIDKPLKGSEQIVQVQGLAYCTIRYETSSVYNGSNYEFISVTSPGKWWKSFGLNCDGITYDSKEWYITNSRTQVVASADGITSYTYTDPVWGMVVSAEKPFSIFETFTI